MHNRTTWHEVANIIALASGLVLCLLICLLPIYAACRTGSELADNLYLGTMGTTFFSFIIFGCFSYPD